MDILQGEQYRRNSFFLFLLRSLLNVKYRGKLRFKKFDDSLEYLLHHPPSWPIKKQTILTIS